MVVYQAGMLFAPEAAAQGPQGALVLQTVSGGSIYVLEAGSLGETRLRYLTTGMDPALSPDGQQVAFTRWEDTQHGAPGSLWVINLEGTGERMLFLEQAQDQLSLQYHGVDERVISWQK